MRTASCLCIAVNAHHIGGFKITLPKRLPLEAPRLSLSNEQSLLSPGGKTSRDINSRVASSCSVYTFCAQRGVQHRWVHATQMPLIVIEKNCRSPFLFLNGDYLVIVIFMGEAMRSLSTRSTTLFCNTFMQMNASAITVVNDLSWTCFLVFKYSSKFRLTL